LDDVEAQNVNFRQEEDDVRDNCRWNNCNPAKTKDKIEETSGDINVMDEKIITGRPCRGLLGDTICDPVIVVLVCPRWATCQEDESSNPHQILNTFQYGPHICAQNLFIVQVFFNVNRKGKIKAHPIHSIRYIIPILLMTINDFPCFVITVAIKDTKKVCFVYPQMLNKRGHGYFQGRIL
jgi:hypothetical protein